MQTQVTKDHYVFSSYMHKRRWCSVWHQLDEVLALKPANVLEIGPGPGVFKTLAIQFGVDAKTLDIAEDLKPDYVASAAAMPFDDQSFDVVCAFQMLEHLPFELSLKVMAEMSRVAKKGIVISLPDAEEKWPYSVHLPKYGSKKFHIKKPFSEIKEHEFDGEHYWEINKKGYELDKFIDKLAEAFSAFSLDKNYLVPENPYHRFFVLKRVI